MITVTSVRNFSLKHFQNKSTIILNILIKGAGIGCHKLQLPHI
jgi:hypothetical protein